MALIDTETGLQALKASKRRPYSTPVITDLEPGSDKAVQLTAILNEEPTSAKCVQCGDEEYEMSSTTDFEPPMPVARAHPTIYLVHLGRQESAKWETDTTYRAERTAAWTRAARALKKRTIEVHGRYCQLATINVEES